MSSNDFVSIHQQLEILEKVVVTMYDRSSIVTCVNDALLELFAHKQRSY